jgi:hypothetical protein
MLADYLAVCGAICGVAGAILNAQKSARAKRWGFGVWLLSNIGLGLWAAGLGAWSVVGMYLIYSITSAWGLWNHAAPKERQ